MVDLAVFAEAVEQRRAEWERVGITVQFFRGQETPKPAAWVVLKTPPMEGELILWVSGECEMMVGNLETGAFEQTHLEMSADAVGEALDELGRRVRADT